ncbi:MAG: hypothetical protein M4579_005424 [Chaenotheca gracillima]|nr:MAG: hypothetical protein M4579_005424 [Chaenotheca gracillima]
MEAASTKSSKLYTIRPIPGKGQGLVTTTKILKGTRILTESPAFRVPRDVSDIEAVEQVVNREVDRLSKARQQAFHSLSNIHGTGASSALGIARTNVLPLGADAREGGLFLEASRINHSCVHNAQNTWNTTLGQLTIHVFKDLEEGEEITISYLEGSESYVARQQRLKKSFGFDCTCELCSLPPDQRQESDQRLKEITRLDGLIGDGGRITSTPLACLREAHALLRLLEQAHIADARIPRLYYDVLQIAIANGDQARAKVFAERACAARTVLEGADSPETIRLKEFAEKPAKHRLFETTEKWKQALKAVPEGLSELEFDDWLWRRKRPYLK